MGNVVHLFRGLVLPAIAWAAACGSGGGPPGGATEMGGESVILAGNAPKSSAGEGAAAPAEGEPQAAATGGAAGVEGMQAAAGSGGMQAADPGGSEAGANAQPATSPETFRSGEDLDPSVSFEWPESPPGDGSDCPAGTYTGSFECTFTDTGGLLLPIVLNGPVSLTFEQSADGEFLEITDGDFVAVANLVVGARAQIRGRLVCSTLELDAMAVDGEWAIGDPDLPLIPGGGLEGEITGTLDPATGELSGEWTFGDPALGSCPGTWSVTYVP